MPDLILPAGFALPNLITTLSSDDTMVGGDPGHYLRVGLSALSIIETALADSPEPRTILDLPCGFGRVTRVLRARYPDASITVCDLDRAGVDFSAATFEATGTYSESDFRDLDLGRTFDLIWVGSLLTHLPEHQTRQFFDFAVRHMEPNSRLVVTSHGEYVATQLRSWTYGLGESAARGLIAQYLEDGYAYRGYNGNPSYGISLVKQTWYDSLLTESPLRLRSYQERAWDRHQDVVVMQLATQSVAGPSLVGGGFFEFSAPRVPLSGAKQAKLDDQGVVGFDEDWYCNTFTDVAAAVQRGEYPSGYAHYLEYGWREGRPPSDPQLNYNRRNPPNPSAWVEGVGGGTSRVNEAWSVSPDDQAADVGWYWMAHPVVRSRSNFLASGHPDRDTYTRLAEFLREQGWTLPIPRSISIGCGFGALERDLSARGLIGEVDAYDISTGAIVEAERQAQQLGLKQIRYHVADLEKIDLPPAAVDAIFAHSSVHHVEQLDALYATARQALRPGGVLHLHEYVGPTRFQWTDTQLQLANEFLDSLPPRLRQTPGGKLKDRLRRPTIGEMIAADPSEAVRSEEVIPALRRHFDIVEYRPLGGSLAHIALGGIAQNFDPLSEEDNAFLRKLFEMEDAAMASGSIGSDFATIVATPKEFINY